MGKTYWIYPDEEEVNFFEWKNVLETRPSVVVAKNIKRKDLVLALLNNNRCNCWRIIWRNLMFFLHCQPRNSCIQFGSQFIILTYSFSSTNLWHAFNVCFDCWFYFCLHQILILHICIVIASWIPTNSQRVCYWGSDINHTSLIDC